MTLVELLVAMVIGLGVTLAVASLLVAGENHKRTTTSSNDAEQTGAYSVYALDRALRSAGSAIAESADLGGLGCRLNAAQILPRTTPFPLPFAANFLPGATANLRVAPILIGQQMSDDNVSDVLVVMGGSGSAGGVPRPNTGPPPTNSLLLESTVGFFQYDLILVSNINQTSAIPDCLIEGVQAVASPTTLTLGTTNGSPPTYYYYTANGLGTSLATMAADATSSYITPLGNAQANNVQFQLFGVGGNYTLYSYDLLQNQLKVQGIGTDVSQPLADGVIQMNAIYGINNNGVQSWAGPGDAGYDINSVMTNVATMKSIIAVRVALVVRGEYYDKNSVSPAKLTIFNGLTDANNVSLSQQVTLPDQHYRYRVFEFTVPLRNMLILAGI
jgi:type IV pilus assembly protein PilW